jgi:hypothetical protein
MWPLENQSRQQTLARSNTFPRCKLFHFDLNRIARAKARRHAGVRPILPAKAKGDMDIMSERHSLASGRRTEQS